MQSRNSIVLLLLALLAACTGGSGSSGFDISPAAENRVIDTAIEEQRCVTREGLTICPAGQPFEHIPSVPGSMPGREEVKLTILAAPVNIDACPPPSACELPIHLDTQGIPESAIYQLAVRESSVSGWRLSRSAGQIDSTAGFDGAVAVSAPGASVQVAVLVYLAAEPFAPGEVETLHQTGAELVFVDTGVRIVPAM